MSLTQIKLEMLCYLLEGVTTLFEKPRLIQQIKIHSIQLEFISTNLHFCHHLKGFGIQHRRCLNVSQSELAHIFWQAKKRN